MEAVTYFMSNRINSKLSLVIMAYGLTSVILVAFWAKLVELSRGKPRIRVPFECQQCGQCCLKHGNCLRASKEDIEIWVRAGRTDILQWVGPNGDLWIKSSTGKKFWRCPFLRKVSGKNKYICKIYNARPEACRDYPANKKQALKDGCSGLINNAKKEKTKAT
jgi:Fe-S-cluster containining protein